MHHTICRTPSFASWTAHAATSLQLAGRGRRWWSHARSCARRCLASVSSRHKRPSHHAACLHLGGWHLQWQPAGASSSHCLRCRLGTSAELMWARQYSTGKQSVWVACLWVRLKLVHLHRYGAVAPASTEGTITSAPPTLSIITEASSGPQVHQRHHSAFNI